MQLADHKHKHEHITRSHIDAKNKSAQLMLEREFIHNIIIMHVIFTTYMYVILSYDTF